MSDSDETEFDRLPVIIRYAESTKFTEVYGFVGSQGFVVLEGQRLVPRDIDSSTVFLFMHPTATVNLLPVPQALAAAGLHVLCAASRYPKNDSALIMEKVALDLGAYIRFAKEDLGYDKVVLVGWSGGGSLSLFYQSQAERPSITHTAAGDPCDLISADLPRADGVVFIAAHLSRAETLTEWLDPSVVDESDPYQRDLEFDIYDDACPNRPPFTSDFVDAFRARQRARNARITSWVDEQLDRLRRSPGDGVERAFVVHRTMCDVRWIDPSVDPNGRKPNWCYLGDPRVANSAPAGLARYTSLRSWLSQWSLDRAQTSGVVSARRISSTPVLQIENQADDAVPATHNPLVHRELATADKQLTSLDGATHYYVGQPEQLQACIDTIRSWASRHDLLVGG